MILTTVRKVNLPSNNFLLSVFQMLCFSKQFIKITVLPSCRERKGEVLVAQLCLTLCDSRDCSLPGSSVHGILQARILEWVTISFSKASSRSRVEPWVSCITGRFFTVWASKDSLIIHLKVWNEVGEGEGGMIWENSIETCVLSYVK